MGRGVARFGVLLLLAALVLAVPQAHGRTLDTTTVFLQVLGGGEVTYGAGTLDCGAGQTTCYAIISSGSTLTLNAISPPGWAFSGWSNGSTDCFGTLPTCSLPLDGETHEEVAEFTPITPQGTTTLRVTASTGGVVEGGDVDCVANGAECSTTVTTGSTLTLVETAASGYTFSGWNGDCGGTSAACTVTMETNRAVSAAFTLSAATRILTVSVSGAGSVSDGEISCTSAGGSGCTANETLGSQVTLTAKPDAGKEFTGWGGDCSGTSTTCTVTMAADRNVTAAFSGGPSSVVALSVSVNGPGSVTGGGIACGSVGSTCKVDVAVGAKVTLTATPDAGATFSGWGGACTGSAKTCTLTMSTARTVSAGFGGGTTPSGKQATLTLHVSGKGTIASPAGRCSASGGSRTCRNTYASGTEVVLTAEPAAGQRLVRWSGACAGTGASCTVVLSTARSVTATFTGATVRTALRSTGRPLVKRARRGFEVVLRFTASRAGTARVRALRAGRVLSSFSFTAAAGPARIGPFAIAQGGYYTFELSLGGAAIRWKACLGRCGAAAPAAPFALVREPARVTRAGALWSLTVHFHASQPAEARLRVYRGGKIARSYRFLPLAGSVSAGPLLLTPGAYTIRLTATDAYGRVQRLTWVALLP
jgi:uncharacterized repeat protein (TIGR02543 family)